jgi:5S rRNA maturation endonuclease (ribonuclease M5)
MNQKERLEEIEKILEELIDLNSQIPILVEGRKDIKSLKGLGVMGEIIKLNTGNSLFNMCEKLSVAHDKVIILTDWDRRGGQLCRLLKEGFMANNVKCNDNIRMKLVWLCKKEIKDVEGLSTYISRLRRELIGSKENRRRAEKL